MKVIIAVNSSWNAWNYRRGLINALIKEGHEVTVVAPYDSFSIRLGSLGCSYHSVHMESRSVNPISDFRYFFALNKIIRMIKPHVVLSFTIKPNIYAGLCGKFNSVPVIANVSGLGVVFDNHGWLQFAARQLYRFGMTGCKRVFFQNAHDLDFFIYHNLISSRLVERLPGSGVNLSYFPFVPVVERSSQTIKFLAMGRLLREKGFEILCEALYQMRCANHMVECTLVGFLDEQRNNAISERVIRKWEEIGVIKFVNAVDDVRPYIRDSDCVVLPSFYGEGTPRALLEGAAMGRPVITTDSIGCRDVVIDGVTGFLCEPKSINELSKCLIKFVKMSTSDRRAMGLAGRRLMERRFDEKIVIKKYFDAIAEYVLGIDF